MDRDAVSSEKREVAVGKCEVPKEEQNDFKQVDIEPDRDIPYNDSTRYYWF